MGPGVKVIDKPGPDNSLMFIGDLYVGPKPDTVGLGNVSTSIIVKKFKLKSCLIKRNNYLFCHN